MNRWPEVTYAEIEDAVGGQLPPLPEHEELYAQVLAAGGGRHEPIERLLFAAVPVGDIPGPHDPYKCRHAARFKAIRDELQDPDAGRDVLEELAGRRFLDSLSWWDRVRCSYHWARWRAIADESVRILKAVGPADTDVYAEAAERSRLRGRNRRLLQSLFDDPVVVVGGGFTNGQHRGCALRFSGATHTALVVGDERLGDEEIVWTYVGGG
jgi:hypothetical protein